MRDLLKAGVMGSIVIMLPLTGAAEIITIKGSSTPLETASPARQRASRSNSRSSSDWNWETPEFLSSWEDRIEIGTRIIGFQLQDDHKAYNPVTRNGFLGTVTDLDAEQDYAPTRLFVDYLVEPTWGFELSYDKLGAETKTTPDGGREVKSDGTLELSGFIASVFGRYPNDTDFTPYGGIGWAFYQADFDETAHWALGYNGPADYAANGSPSTLQPGRRHRTMNVDDTNGLVLYGGALWSFHENWAVDLYLRYVDVEVDANFIGTVNGVVETDKDGTFPMEHVGYGLSVHYIF